MKKYFLYEIFIGLMILLFVYSGVSKLVDFASFQRSMHNQPFVEWLADFAIWAVPSTEIIAAIFLMNYKTRLLGISIFFITMVIFTIYIAAIVMHFFPRVPCSCGELIRSLSWSQHLVFNLFFVLISGYLLIKRNELRTAP